VVPGIGKIGWGKDPTLTTAKSQIKRGLKSIFRAIAGGDTASRVIGFLTTRFSHGFNQAPSFWSTH
jgi:hypothetical protein